MSDVYTFGKKLFTLSVVAVTIAWSMGLAALVPAVAQAEETCSTLEAGDLYKVPGSSAVYLVSKNMGRKPFPSYREFKAWGYKDADVKMISVSCGSNYPSDGMVQFPAGYLVKNTTFAAVYQILPGGELAHIGNEQVAKDLYGTDWVKAVSDVADVFLDSYTDNKVKVSEAKLQNGMLVKISGGTDTYYVSEGKKLKVDGTLPTASVVVRTISQTVFDTVETGSTTITEAEILSGATGSKTPPAPAPTTTSTPVTGGSVDVSLSANSPAAANVVINIDNVVFTKVILKAGDKEAVVNAVKIGRKGLGSTDDFASVTLYDGSTKLGSTKTSWHSDGYMVYNVAGGWKIPVNTSKELTIIAKLDTASSFNALGVLDVTLANSGIVSGVPVYGNQMSGVSVAVGGVTIANQGSNATKKIGSTESTLANFKLTVSSTEDGVFKKITLKNKAATSNAADTDIANMSLYMGTKKLAGPVSMVSDKITFVLDEPVDIGKSKNETFKVVGDVVNGDANTVEFVLDATTDLEVTGKTYNTSLTVHSNSYDAATEGMIITIDGAELNLAYTGNNLDTIDDKTDIPFGTLTLSAGATDIKITSLKLTVDETNGDSDATNNKDVDEFEMVDSAGGAYSGTMTGGGDTDADDETWTFTDEIYLSAKESRTFELRGDLPNGIGNGDSYKVSATINTTNVVAETVPAGDSVSNFSIGSFTGKTVTVKTPTLKVTGSTLNAETVVVNDANVILYKGTLEAQADNIKVTYADFNANTTFSTGNWTEIGIYTVDASGAYVPQQILTSSQMSSSTSNSGQALAFDSLDFTVKNGPTNKVTFVVKGTVASSLNTNTAAQIKLDYFTGKASDNSSATITSSGSDDLSTADGAFLTAGGRALTLAATGNLKLQMRSTDTGFSKDRIVLAGSSAWVGKLKLIASNEDVKVKDLKLSTSTASSGLTDDDLASVCLYRAQAATAENLISCQQLDSTGVVFYDDIDEVVVGTEYWYIYVNTNLMNDGATGTADSHAVVAFNISTSTAGSVAAEGIRSGDTYTITDDTDVGAGEIGFDEDNDDTYDEAAELDMTTTTPKFVIAGTKISNVQLVGNFSGETVNTVLSGTGEYTAAILAVTTEATENTDSSGNALKTLLTGVRFDVDKFASTSFSGATIKKIGGLDVAGALTVDDLDDTTSTAGTFINTDLTALLPNDHKIDPGTTSYYVVKATIDSLSAADNTINWFRFDLDDIKGTYNSDANESITWKDGSSSTAFQALLLDTENITGTKVAEAS